MPPTAPGSPTTRPARAARHPDRVGRLALITPSPRPVDLEVTDLDRRQVAEQRRGEPWFADAAAALERIGSGDANGADWEAIVPFTYGHWDAGLQAPVLLLAGAYDVVLPPGCAADYARLFPRAGLAVQPGAGHFPWLDDPGSFVHTLAGFLR